jgi:CubicO group peptidase (beta-lactamase class C family)
MNKHRLTFLLPMIGTALLVAAPAFAGESAVDARIQKVESGLLPLAALKEHLGRTLTIEQRMQELGIPGVSIAVIDRGKIAWTRAYGMRDTVEKAPVTVDTLFQAGSISKPVAALGALRLVKEGALSLDGDVNAKLKTWRVPENEFTKDAKVTLRRLVSHTAGLTVHGFPGYAVGSDVPNVVQVLDGQPPANTDAVRVNVKPGSVYRYSGGGYTVMQLLMADASNQSFESFTQSKVLNVLGMRSSTFSQSPSPALAARRASAHRPGGERIPGKHHIYPEMAAAGLWTTSSDLARYVLFVQSALRGETGELLTPTLAKELVTRQNPGQHGLGPQIEEVGQFGRFGHGGVDEGFEAEMVGYIASGRGLVIMANANLAGMLFDEIKASVARAYEWPGYPVPPQIEVQPISRSVLDRAPGKYQLNPRTAGTLVARDGRLFLELAELGALEVFQKSPTELFSPPLGPITFQLAETDGKVTGLKVSDGREFARVPQ